MRLLIGLLIAIFGAVPQSPAPGEADEILAQLGKVRLDTKQIYKIRDITIRRDVLSIVLNRGTIAFLEPAMGKVTGAVFIGSGEAVAIVPDAVEKQQIYEFTGSPILNEPFQAAFFRFTDGAYEEILKEHSQHAIEEVSEEEAAEFIPWEQSISERSSVQSYRILADLLEPAGAPFFFGELNGANLGWFDVIYDPRLVEELAIFKVHLAANGRAADIWASFNRRSETRDPASFAHENKSAVDVLSYDIDAAISETRLDAQAAMRVGGRVNGARVLNFDLARTLQVSSISLDSGEPVSFYRAGGDALVIVLPRALEPGREITLRFAYSGDNAGPPQVHERGLWYPSRGYEDPAIFNLTFHYPQTYTLVATGNKAKEWDEGGRRHAIWNSGKEFSVAGFHAGNFTIVADESGAVPIYVCVNSDIDAENALKELRAAVTYFSSTLGPFPYGRLTVAPFPVSLPQSWPTLMGFQPEPGHEIAHQWFGNQVGWAGYRDQWIFEGFARYAGAMYSESKNPGSPRLREILGEARSRAPEGGGPVSLGQRLASTRTPDGYDRIVNNKSPWIVHMLRMLMREEGPNPDAAFLRMTREFLETHSGGRASTWDLKRVAEKHMTKAMDLRDDRKMDWFFDQWVFGTGIPTYTLEHEVAASQDGFIVQGTIKQSGVPDTFIMSVPVYADDDLLGRVVVSDEEGNFRFAVKSRPSRVALDPHGTVLAKGVN